MTTKERVLTCLKEWAGKAMNPHNECLVGIAPAKGFSNQYQISLGGACVWSWDGDQEPDGHWEAAARILRIGSPWRLTSEELPDAGQWVWACHNPNGRPIIVRYYGPDEWYGNSHKYNPPLYWMPIPELPK